ncbi:hypothetical protein NI17_014885 [Thermobifida halotolerans]|uniref:Uncharacterized protein n=1 Tax=Thermobifida halotolerans TaxID=483545 RepID=A0A399G2W6_9ACTN|nr:hypothetical protein [Thermobifida halotolerans]UOE18130.1 hypothetical protein NI17_014885 [Thermobifida halotolerans]
MTSRPFEPNPQLDREEIAAADPGPGAPPQAPGFGVENEEPDRPETEEETEAGEDPPANR